MIEEGVSEKPRKVEPFKNVISIECGAEHNLLLVERDIKDNESNADEEDAFNYDQDEQFGINILEDALVMAGNLDVESDKDQKKEEKEKSLVISLTNSVEWLSQSTMNVTSAILPNPVTNIIASTIATTSSTISSTYSYGESLLKGFLVNKEQSKQKVRTDCVSQIAGAPRALTDLFVWGRNGHGQLGTGDTADVIEPVKLQAVSSKGIIAILARGNLSFAITSTWEVWAWGEDFQKETKLKLASVLHTLTAHYLSMPNSQGGYEIISTSENQSRCNFPQIPPGNILSSTFDHHYQLFSCQRMKCIEEITRSTKQFSRYLGTLRKTIVRPLLNECQVTGTFAGFNGDLSAVFGLL